MSIEKRQILRFVPPLLDGNEKSEKIRYMLVIDSDEITKEISMINISSIKGKEGMLLNDANMQIDEYRPLHIPSFVKLKTTYKIKFFKELEDYIFSFGGKIRDTQFEKIINERINYQKKHNDLNEIIFTEEEFKKCNKSIIKN
ncbi:MAG: hypothetical protein ACI4VQ_05165 [Clostridia bacterium]